MVLHGNHTQIEISTGGGTPGEHIVCFIAFILFALVSALLPSVAIGTKVQRAGVPWIISNPISLQAFATGMLACGWLFSGLNPILFNGGSVSRVIVNAVVWSWSLSQLADFYDVKEPLRSTLFQPIKWTALAFLVLVIFGDAGVRFVGMIAALPLAIVVVLSATLWSSCAERAVWHPSHVTNHLRSVQHDLSSLFGAGMPAIRPGQVLFGAVALVGLYSLITEMLSKEYSGTVSLTVSFAFMLPGHTCLVVLWIMIALMGTSETVPLSEGGLTNSAATRFEPDMLAQSAAHPSLLDDQF